MTVGEALSSSGIDAREARLLLAAATGFSQASVLAHPERELPAEIQKSFQEMAARLGVVTTGKSYLDVLQALEYLGLDARACSELGIRVWDAPGVPAEVASAAVDASTRFDLASVLGRRVRASVRRRLRRTERQRRRFGNQREPIQC